MITYQDQAIPIFSIPPNWRESVVLSEQYAVIIQETLDTSEERLATRPRPMFKVQYQTMALSARETGYTKRILEQANALPVGVGLWQDAALLSADAAAGTCFLAVEDTTGNLFDVCPYVMVWSDFETFTTHRIAASGATWILLADPLTTTFHEGDTVVPMVIGKLAKPPAAHLTDENGAFAVDFEEAFFSEGPMLGHTITGAAVEATRALEFELIGGPIL